MELVNVESDGTSKNLNLIKGSIFFKYLILSNEKYAINFSKVFENGTPKGLYVIHFSEVFENGTPKGLYAINFSKVFENGTPNGLYAINFLQSL